MCGDRSVGLQHEVKVAKQQMAVLKATVAKAQDEESQYSVQIEQLVASLSAGEETLKQAAAIRGKEALNVFLGDLFFSISTFIVLFKRYII